MYYDSENYSARTDSVGNLFIKERHLLAPPVVLSGISARVFIEEFLAASGISEKNRQAFFNDLCRLHFEH